MTADELDDQVTDAMMRFGGGFISRLGQLFRYADPVNQARLKAAFPDYWAQFAELARAAAEYAATKDPSRAPIGCVNSPRRRAISKGSPPACVAPSDRWWTSPWCRRPTHWGRSWRSRLFP